MTTRTLETDYLVVGAGAGGMAFTDALIADSDAEVVMVDRRHAPGGHWLDAYPFVRLHQPSSYYGVNSLALGSETIDTHGPNKGLYERAGGPELCAYYDRVMQQRLMPSGKVRYFPMSEYVGPHRFVSPPSGVEYEVTVRKKVVDATYLETSVPATSAPPFDVATDASCVPVNQLTRMVGQADRYVIIGAGKTAADACLWLLEIGIAPDDIRWIKPRESWYINRVYMQGGELVATFFEGIAAQTEAAAHATSAADLFHRLEAGEQLLRVNRDVTPAVYRGATMSTWEIEQLARIRGVVRLGRVRRIDRDGITLDEGSVSTSRGHVHVHCATRGLNPAPGVPLFTNSSITLQSIRTGLMPFNSALTGFVEATRGDTAEKNRLCPPNKQPDTSLDWLACTLVGMQADYGWSKDPAISSWLERSRLNVARGLRSRTGEPGLQSVATKYAQNARPAVDNLRKLLMQASN